MAYSNSEQIFIDVLGRAPTEPEWKEIHALLGAATRTGCVVDDESNAVQVVWLAWGWVRGIGRADVLALLRGRLQDVDTALEDVRNDMGEAIKSLQDALTAFLERPSAQPSSEQAPQINAEELAKTLGPLLGARVLAVHQHYDIVDSLKQAATKGFSVFWALVGSVICAALFGLLAHVYVSDSHEITALQNQNAMLVQQITDAQRGPSERTRP
ncbi:conserved hypothetical protein [Thiomonas sp. CB3]|nr:conserved hypothetical protein [Thiomonas sp. CB3]CQR43913.1 conserved hypothetical protein [Thiomonas sp. CB3]